MAKKKVTNFVATNQKRFSKTITKLSSLVKGRSYKKLEEKLDVNIDRLRGIKSGKIEPTKSEISKITAFSWEKEKEKEKLKDQKLGITPSDLHKYVGFSAEQIKARMHPKFKFLSKSVAKNSRINKLYKSDKKQTVTATKNNRQQVYYYVTIEINNESGQSDVFGHNFMNFETAKQRIEKDGLIWHTIYEKDDGMIYKEIILILSVLTFPKLFESFNKHKLLDWTIVPPAVTMRA